MTQTNLGTTLRTLGELESWTARLEEALPAWGVCLIVVASAWPPAWVRDVHSDETLAEMERQLLK